MDRLADEDSREDSGQNWHQCEDEHQIGHVGLDRGSDEGDIGNGIGENHRKAGLAGNEGGLVARYMRRNSQLALIETNSRMPRAATMAHFSAPASLRSGRSKVNRKPPRVASNRPYRSAALDEED